MSLRSKLSPIITNFKGIKIPQKYVVIESDDWGSIRMPSQQAFDELSNFGIPCSKSAYLKFDSLECNSDLENLFEVLHSVKDSKGNPAVMTANTVVGNPNFDEIKKSEFQNYQYEPFTKTLERYPESDRVFELYKNGIVNGIFFPQFHGREHVNIPLWFNLLKSDSWFQKAFELELWGLSADIKSQPQGFIQGTFDHLDHELAKKSLSEGLQLFESLFGYKSNTIIPNNYVWNNDLNSWALDNGINHFQGFKLQFAPKENSSRSTISRKMGETNEWGQTYGIRNCFFEPTEMGDSVDSVLWDVSVAFKMKKPAIICTHRINFAGRLDSRNRDQNLKSLKNLLEKITSKWPDVQFITSHQLQEIFHAKSKFSSI